MQYPKVRQTEGKRFIQVYMTYQIGKAVLTQLVATDICVALSKLPKTSTREEYLAIVNRYSISKRQLTSLLKDSLERIGTLQIYMVYLARLEDYREIAESIQAKADRVAEAHYPGLD